jgi:hypothetical protein
MWEPFLWLALIVAAWRWFRHPTAHTFASNDLPDVANAPADAEPVIRPRLDDNGLATYTMVVPRAGEESYPTTGPSP